MACVLAGEFQRGIDEDPHVCEQSGNRTSRAPSSPAATVMLSTFFIDKTEVTNAAYTACVASGKCAKSGPRYRDFSAPDQPITGVSWYEAQTYCEAQGKQLPTEAQWEKAARGSDGQAFPWGDAPATCDRAVIRDGSGRACGRPKKGSKPEAGRVWEVAQKPAGRFGIFDMAGNAEEWVADWWSPG